jgi:hypothetical protein
VSRQWEIGGEKTETEAEEDAQHSTARPDEAEKDRRETIT